MKNLSIIAIMLAVFVTACCPPKNKQVEHVAPQEKIIVKEVVRGGAGCDTCSLIEVTANAPKEAVIGQTYAVDTNVKGLNDAGDVVISTRIPNNATYVKSEPPATVNGNKLTWTFDSINKGEVKNIKVWLTATGEGRVGLCYTALALPRYCVDTLIGKPLLQITKTGPATASLNDDVAYRITVTNRGTAAIKNLTVTDPVPQGLALANGASSWSQNVGDLAPGASKDFTVSFKAVRRGKVCNVATANSSNAGQVSAEACTEITSKSLDLTCNATPEGKIGQRGEVKLCVVNTGDTKLTNVTITAEVPAELQVISAEGAQPSNTIVWRNAGMNSQGQACYTIVVAAKNEGNYCVKVTVQTAEGLSKTTTCCTKWTGSPSLTIAKTGPERATWNQDISYTVTVTNNGTATARNVVVVDRLPQGLAHASGQNEVRYPIGDMPPGASKSLQVPVKATGNGRVCNTATAEAANVGSVKAEACTTILRYGAELKISCEKNSFLGKEAKSNIVLENTGDVALTNVVVTATWPNGLVLRSAEGNPTQQPGQAVWRVPSIEARSTKTWQIVAISKQAGEQCINVTMNTNEGVTKQANCCTAWRGFPALLLEVIDTNDPLLTDEVSNYVVEVTNQGTAEDTNVKIEVVFPGETTPISLANDNATAGRIDGKKVSFQPYPRIDPKQKIKWIITAKAVNKGDARVRIEMTSSLLKQPVFETESTQVY